MWTPFIPIKPYNAACSDCGVSAEIAGGMRRGLCRRHYDRLRWRERNPQTFGRYRVSRRLDDRTMPPVEPYPPRTSPSSKAKRSPDPGNTIAARARREKRRGIAAARLARVGLPLRLEPGEMPRPTMPNNSRAWVRGESTKLT